MNVPAASSEAFVVELQEFRGPLDLLLSLIREEKVDISDIPIARIAEQFLQRIQSLGIHLAADYLEMAGRLLRIKAQMLLPRAGEDEEWEDPRAELVRRLLEYQQIREMADHLERLAEARRSRLARGFVPESQPRVAAVVPVLSLVEFLAAVDRVIRLARDPHIHDVVSRALDVEGAVARIRSLLASRPSVRWADIVPPSAERWALLSVLLALLELARLGEVRISQPEPFGNLVVFRESASQAA
ncbi:MAG TPA: segregation/condensation protein A [Gemmatimonadaceae bacterium]|nr:segregation/condensation protein A [Gemmatimonadaceae bacterium]